MTNSDQFDPFRVSEEMRSFAQTSLDQARKAFDDLMAASTKAMTQASDASRNLQSEAEQMRRGVLDYAQNSVANSFDFAAQLAKAKSTEEVMDLQKQYLENQMKAAQSEMKRLGESAAKITKQSTGSGS